MESKKEMIANALRMRANYIETGKVTMSRNDAITYNRSIDKSTFGHSSEIDIKVLSDDQIKLVLTMRKLADKIEFS